MAQPGTVPGAALELHAARAALGASPGINSPLTTTWFDTSGNGNHGALTNFGAQTPWAGTGTLADPYRLLFDGTDDRVTVPHVAGLAFGADFTVELRTMGLVAVGGWFFMCYKGPADTPNYGVEGMIAAQQTTGTLGKLRACVGPWFTDATTYATVIDWALPHHVILTRRAGYCHLYVDTVENDVGRANTQDLSTVTGQWNIGNGPTNTTTPQAGGTVLFRQYSFGFIPAQVAQNYAAGIRWLAHSPFGPIGGLGRQLIG